MWTNWANSLLLKALKSCLKSNKLPYLVTLVIFSVTILDKILPLWWNVQVFDLIFLTFLWSGIFYIFVLSLMILAIICEKLSTNLFVWLNSNKLNRRLAVQWCLPLWSTSWVFSDFCTDLIFLILCPDTVRPWPRNFLASALRRSQTMMSAPPMTLSRWRRPEFVTPSSQDITWSHTYLCHT